MSEKAIEAIKVLRNNANVFKGCSSVSMNRKSCREHAKILDGAAELIEKLIKPNIDTNVSTE